MLSQQASLDRMFRAALEEEVQLRMQAEACASVLDAANVAMGNELVALRLELEAAHDAAEAAGRRHGELAAQLAEKARAATAREQELVATRELLTEMEADRAYIVSLEQEVTALSEELGSVRMAAEQTSQGLFDHNARLENGVRELQLMHAQLAAAAEQAERLLEDKVLLEKDLAKTSEELERARVSAEALSHSLVECNIRLDEGARERLATREQLEKALDESAGVASGFAAASREAERLGEEVRAVRAGVAALEAEKACLEENLDGLRLELERARAASEVASQEASALRGEMSAALGSVAALEVEKACLEKDFDGLRLELERARAASEMASQEALALRGEMSAALGGVAALEAEKACLEENLDGLRRELERARAASEAASHEASALRGEMSAALGSVAALEAEKARLEKDLESLRLEQEAAAGAAAQRQNELVMLLDRRVRELAAREQDLVSVRDLAGRSHSEQVVLLERRAAEIAALEQEIASAWQELERLRSDAEDSNGRLEEHKAWLDEGFAELEAMRKQLVEADTRGEKLRDDARATWGKAEEARSMLEEEIARAAADIQRAYADASTRSAVLAESIAALEGQLVAMERERDAALEIAQQRADEALAVTVRLAEVSLARTRLEARLVDQSRQRARRDAIQRMADAKVEALSNRVIDLMEQVALVSGEGGQPGAITEAVTRAAEMQVRLDEVISSAGPIVHQLLTDNATLIARLAELEQRG